MVTLYTNIAQEPSRKAVNVSFSDVMLKTVSLCPVNGLARGGICSLQTVAPLRAERRSMGAFRGEVRQGAKV
jgi:hypothetical protein